MSESRTAHSAADESAESLVGRVADEFLARQERGESPDAEEYAARYPHAADLIRRTLAALKLAAGSLGGTAADPTSPPLPEALGDYRLVREVGRGGMGVVYEAEQLSLRRRVALKVLPFAAVMDPRHFQRFRNEATAAAALEHPNVVKVYAVGCDRGVHYIAMQFVDGRSLAEILRERRGEAATPSATGTAVPGETAPASVQPTGSRTPTDAAFARRVAEWGSSAADALEHAHALGVVHRDVKPANLLVDSHGSLHVADFGLARMGRDGSLTGTGDLLGTPRYMSPEQASTRHNLVDHRSDVYSLGATLYELLTLEPVVPGSEAAEILRRLADSDPVPPRSVDRNVPRDLETVVLKCLAKDPERRYQSAMELADDLRLFLAGERVRAKPPTLTDRIGRWAGRHWRAVAGVFALLLLALGVSVAAAAIVRGERDDKAKALGERDDALTAATTALGERNTALGKVREEANNAVAARAEGQRRLDEAMRLSAAVLSLVSASVLDGRYRSAVDLLRQSIALAETLMGPFPARPDFARPLAERYHSLGEILEQMGWAAPAADAFERYLALVTAIGPEDFPGGNAAGDESVGRVSLGLAYDAVARTSRAAGRYERAEAVARTAVAHWRNLVVDEQVPALAATYRHFEAVQRSHLGAVLIDLGRTDEAEGCLRTALGMWAAFGPDDGLRGVHPLHAGIAHARLGELLWAAGRTDEARAEFRAALATWAKGDPDSTDRCWFLAFCPDPEFRDPTEAVRIAEKTMGANSLRPAAWRLLAAVRYQAGDWKGVQAALGKLPLLQLDSDASHLFLFAMAEYQLGDVVTARRRYWGGVRRLDVDNPRDREGNRLRAEAARLLGVLAPPPRPK